jgi:hypothetical protein
MSGIDAETHADVHPDAIKTSNNASTANSATMAPAPLSFVAGEGCPTREGTDMDLFDKSVLRPFRPDESIPDILSEMRNLLRRVDALSSEHAQILLDVKDSIDKLTREIRDLKR